MSFSKAWDKATPVKANDLKSNRTINQTTKGKEKQQSDQLEQPEQFDTPYSAFKVNKKELK